MPPFLEFWPLELVLRPVTINSLLLSSQPLGEATLGDPQENDLTTRKQILACPSWARTHGGEMTSDLER